MFHIIEIFQSKYVHRNNFSKFSSIYFSTIYFHLSAPIASLSKVSCIYREKHLKLHERHSRVGSPTIWFWRSMSIFRWLRLRKERQSSQWQRIEHLSLVTRRDNCESCEHLCNVYNCQKDITANNFLQLLVDIFVWLKP